MGMDMGVLGAVTAGMAGVGTAGAAMADTVAAGTAGTEDLCNRKNYLHVVLMR
jgi:hypothetical protein